MNKLILGGLTAAAIIAPMAVTSPVAAAQPTTTTHNITVSAASEAVIDLPALNSQFTKMQITVNNGTAFWGSADLDYWTSYQDGVAKPGVEMTTGIWGDPTVAGHGPLLLEGTQVGAVIYRVDGGAWNEVTSAPITVTDGRSHHVQVAYNDRPGSYDDNSGTLALTVVRTKA